MREYNKDHCWQYEMRLQNYESDKEEFGFTKENLEDMRVSDFTFAREGRENFEEIKEFVIKYEWLGTLPPYPTHYMTARYNGKLAGVLIYAMPNAFSKLIGDNTKEKERLLARGATASWTPKNLASAFISWSVDWMVKNTQYRVFSAYSDPAAKELGTVYQASNWYYLGQTSGTTYRYREPGSDKWISCRKFRRTSSFKQYARDFGIEWQDNWSTKRKMHWENVPDEIEGKLRQEGRDRQAACDKKAIPPKHKYVMVKGKNKGETKRLLRQFFERNPKATNTDYPKNRGEW